MFRFSAAFLAVLSCAVVAQAQSMESSTGAPVLTLDNALAQAGASAPVLDAANAGVRAADSARTVAGLRPNPSLTADTENVAGTGPYRGIRGADTTVGISLPMELGGKRSARVALADVQRQQADIDAARARADLRLAVTQAYIEAVAAERRVVIAREQAKIAQAAAQAASVRVTSGRASPIERQRAEIVSINANAAIERSARLLELARGNLARRIGVPVIGSLDQKWFAGAPHYGPARPVDPSGTLAMAAAQTDVKAAEARIRLARSQRVPDITLSAGARRLEATNDTAAVFGVSIPFPMFNNGRAAVNEASARRDQSDALRRAASLDAAQAIATAEAEVANAAEAARIANGPALAAATESARIARIGYREGKFGQLDLLDAERTLSETRTAAIDALVAYHDAQARRDRLLTVAPNSMKD